VVGLPDGATAARSTLTPCILDDDPAQLELLSDMIAGAGIGVATHIRPRRNVATGAVGHVRGAFTGATEMRPGLLEYADGGTVFLDKVGETSLAMQAKLLRGIPNREAQRVGSPEVRHVHVRLIAATNRDLHVEVLAGRFREDLFYRLSSVQIRVPSLSERLEDIPMLVQFFVKKYHEVYGKSIAGLTLRAQTVLLQHPWPGNVRELENVISSAAITTTGDFIDLLRPAGKLSAPQQSHRRRSGVASAIT
jgi:transcriptional regulator with GAF, ATPase, and Fis domain